MRNRIGARLSLAVVLLVNAEVSVLASYKVVLKDGSVVEAMSKPVSMDRQYIIRTTDNKTYTLPLSQVNLDATEAANQPLQNKPPISSVQPAATAPHVQSAQGSSLTNKDVADMHKLGFSSEVIVAKIKSSTCRFDTSLPALQELKASGLPDSVVLMIVQSGSSPAPSPSPSQVGSELVIETRLSKNAPTSPLVIMTEPL